LVFLGASDSTLGIPKEASFPLDGYLVCSMKTPHLFGGYFSYQCFDVRSSFCYSWSHVYVPSWRTTTSLCLLYLEPHPICLMYSEVVHPLSYFDVQFQTSFSYFSSSRSVQHGVTHPREYCDDYDHFVLPLDSLNVSSSSKSY
jgi:hypothetical protein